MEYLCLNGDQKKAEVGHWLYACQRLPNCQKLVDHQCWSGCQLLLQSIRTFFYEILAFFLFFLFSFLVFQLRFVVMSLALVVAYFQIQVIVVSFEQFLTRIILLLMASFQNSIYFKSVLGFQNEVALQCVFLFKIFLRIKLILQRFLSLMLILRIIVNCHLQSLNYLYLGHSKVNL